LACALYGLTSTLADLSDRMTRACPYVLYRLARALDRGSGACTYVSHSRSSALADLSDRVARARADVFDRRTGTFADALDSLACAFDR